MPAERGRVNLSLCPPRGALPPRLAQGHRAPCPTGNREGRQKSEIIPHAPSPESAGIGRISNDGAGEECILILAEDLLKEIDVFAEQKGYTRSGLLAHAAKKMIVEAEEHGRRPSGRRAR